ncbi:MAG: nitrile hydratase accessory protein [Actinomycetota bacterium]
MRHQLDELGPAAPPRANGELAFDEAWQSRLFATTMAACDAGLIVYDDFRDRLIERIAARDDAGADGYWAAWQDALEELTVDVGLVDRTELDERATSFAAHD